MNARNVLGFVLLIVGAVVLFFGVQSTGAFGEKIVHGVTGRYTDNTMAYLIGGGVCAVLGLSVTAYVDIPAGPTIVLCALAAFALTSPVGLVLQRRRAARVPFPVEDADPDATTAYGRAEHRHRHGPGCGHLAIEHGDHVDYVHDGHRHALHEGHYDEH